MYISLNVHLFTSEKRNAVECGPCSTVGGFQCLRRDVLLRNVGKHWQDYTVLAQRHAISNFIAVGT